MHRSALVDPVEGVVLGVKALDYIMSLIDACQIDTFCKQFLSLATLLHNSVSSLPSLQF